MASFACDPCKRLKRKCTKELPSCSLCVRLEKRCEYNFEPRKRPRLQDGEEHGGTRAFTGRLSGIEVAASQHELELVTTEQKPGESYPARTRNSAFPTLYFLDSKAFSRNPKVVLDPVESIPEIVCQALGHGDDITALCHSYFATTHVWAPFISPKRMLYRASNVDTSKDFSLGILIVCMKLIDSAKIGNEYENSTFYWLAKQQLRNAEDASYVSLSVLQAAVLIAMYELSHGICPAAYISVGHASRLGHMMGLHERKGAPRLAEQPDTMTEREEERRTWWMIVILDRYVNLGMPGAPLGTGEPLSGNLLPCDDVEWSVGSLSSNQPLFTPHASWSLDVGHFARSCQAAHVLGRVLRHQNDHEMDKEFRFAEAHQLHNTLTALDMLLQKPTVSANGIIYADQAIALCCSARFLLYDLYACNEDYEGNPTGAEEDLQKLSLSGIMESVERVYELTRRVRGDMVAGPAVTSPMILHCLYYAVTEAVWFYREDHLPRMKVVLDEIVETIGMMKQRWGIADLYLKLLEHEGALNVR